MSDLVNGNSNFKRWRTLKKHHLYNKLYFQWKQWIDKLKLS